MSDLTSRLAKREMPHKDVPICLDLDLIERRDEAMKALDHAARKSRQQEQRLVEPKDSAVAAARQQVADVEQQIRDASIVLRVKGVDRHTYNRWLVECPPRKGVKESFDASKFFLHAAEQSAVYVDEHGSVHDISADEWVHIDETITDGEYDRIAQAVLHVNRAIGAVDVSFFVNGSETTPDS